MWDPALLSRWERRLGYAPVAILDSIDRVLDSHVSYEERVPWLSGVERIPCFVANRTSGFPGEWLTSANGRPKSLNGRGKALDCAYQ